MRDDDVTRGATIDPVASAYLADGVGQKLEWHRPALVAEFGVRVDEVLARVALLARATLHADVLATADDLPSDLPERRALVAKHHLHLRTEAQSLVNRGLLDPKELGPARGTAGDRARFMSVLTYVSIFRRILPAIGARTPVTFDELDRIERDTLELGDRLAIRRHGAERRDAADLRERALTLLIAEYEELRRFVTFIRWHEGDADEIAPSFWAKRKKRRRKPPQEPPPEPPPEDDGTPPPFVT